MDLSRWKLLLWLPLYRILRRASGSRQRMRVECWVTREVMQIRSSPEVSLVSLAEESSLVRIPGQIVTKLPKNLEAGLDLPVVQHQVQVDLEFGIGRHHWHPQRPRKSHFGH